MKIRIYAKHKPYDNGNLGLVGDEMKLTGPPTIRVMEFDKKYFAIEGSHRLAQCIHQNLEPKIVLLSKDVEGLDEYWKRVIPTLPYYDFESAYMLDLSE